MNLTYRENYWQDIPLKNEFLRFLIHIHGLDLNLWDKAGYWDDNYHPFSYLLNDTMISHVSVYSMDMIVAGKRRRVAQISSVGTHEDYRLKGLNRQLTEKAITWAKEEHDFFYLFSDVDAIAFYHKCGFRPVTENNFTTSVDGISPRPGARKIDLENPEDRVLLYKLACNRDTVSDVFGAYTPKLFMFLCLYFMKDNIYFIPELNCLILCKLNEKTLTVYDIVAEKMPAFEKIYQYVSNETCSNAEFLFMVDKLSLAETKPTPADEDNHTHVMGGFPLEGTPFIIPFSAHA